MDANHTLIAHVNSDEVTREQLAKIELKEQATAWFRPIRHIELVETIERSLSALNLTVREEKLAIRRDGQMLFGTMKVEHIVEKDFVTALGFRHANDRTMSIQIVAGVSVFVCDNMSFRGDSLVLRQKHSHNFSLTAQIKTAVSRWRDLSDEFVEHVRDFKTLTLSDDEAMATICNAFHQGVMPLRFLPDVVKEWRSPRHEDFAPRTLWSLENAFTEVQKQQPFTSRMASAQDLSRLLTLRSNG
jgi:hypothetical protein